MSGRIQIVLPHPLLQQLQTLAAAAGQPPSTLAAQMVAYNISQAIHDETPPPAHPKPNLAAGESERPPWLEPYGGSDQWRSEMWAHTVSLHARYPRQLAHLKHDWWKDEAHLEIICALATWRAELDEHATDPREELTFHAQLTDYAQTLRQEGGGITKTWKPGAPPQDWSAE
jgi:hypothetical protein